MLRGVARLPGRPHGQPLYGLRRFCRRQPRNRPSADRVRLFTRLSRGQRRAESPDRFAHPPSSPWSDDAPNPHPLIDRSPLPSCGQQPRRPPGNRSPDRPFLKRPYFPGPPFPAGQPFSPRATARRPPCAQSFPLAGSAAPNPHPLIDRSPLPFCGQQPQLTPAPSGNRAIFSRPLPPTGCRAEKSLPFSASRPPFLRISPAESPPEWNRLPVHAAKRMRRRTENLPPFPAFRHSSPDGSLLADRLLRTIRSPNASDSVALPETARPTVPSRISPTSRGRFSQPDNSSPLEQPRTAPLPHSLSPSRAAPRRTPSPLIDRSPRPSCGQQPRGHPPKKG